MLTIAFRGRKPRHIKGVNHLPWSSFGPFLGTIARVRWSPTHGSSSSKQTPICLAGCANSYSRVPSSAISSAYLRAYSFGVWRPKSGDGESTMFFVLSKTLGIVLVPSNFIIAFGVLGLGLIFWKRRRVGRWLLACCVAALLIFGFSPIGAILLLPLETRFPPWNPDTGDPAGIIVLGRCRSRNDRRARYTGNQLIRGAHSRCRRTRISISKSASRLSRRKFKPSLSEFQRS